jgi:hypothetical protein
MLTTTSSLTIVNTRLRFIGSTDELTVLGFLIPLMHMTCISHAVIVMPSHTSIDRNASSIRYAGIFGVCVILLSFAKAICQETTF